MRECKECCWFWQQEGMEHSTANCQPNELGECPCEEDARHEREETERQMMIEEMEEYDNDVKREN